MVYIIIAGLGFVLTLLPCTYFIVVKYMYQRNSEVVMANVVEVVPRYKAHEYVFAVEYDGKKEEFRILPNTAFQIYKKGDRVKLLRNTETDEVRYKVLDSFYALPIIFISVMGLLFLLSLSLGGL